MSGLKKDKLYSTKKLNVEMLQQPKKSSACFRDGCKFSLITGVLLTILSICSECIFLSLS